MVSTLKAKGEDVGRAQVATIMRENGLVGRTPRPFRRTTDSEHDLPIAPNLVARDFEPPAKNQVWVGDITYVRTWAGWLYLAVNSVNKPSTFSEQGHEGLRHDRVLRCQAVFFPVRGARAFRSFSISRNWLICTSGSSGNRARISTSPPSAST